MRVDCILNSAAYAGAILPGVKKGAAGSPVALQSVFGWVLMGSIDSRARTSDVHMRSHHASVEHDLTKLLERFWEMEEVPVKKLLFMEEEKCYSHFKTTHTRNEDGRFLVRLPFIKKPQLSGTRAIAESCLRRIEKRFEKQPELKEAYTSFMPEYEEMHHMQVVPPDQVNFEPSSFLPQHSVINPLKTRQNLAEISRNELCHPLHNQKKNTRVFSFVDYNCL